MYHACERTYYFQFTLDGLSDECFSSVLPLFEYHFNILLLTFFFPGAKTEDMFHYLVPLPEKMPDYVILHVGTNDAIDYEASDIVKKILQVKKFIKLRIPNCKVIISRLIKRHDNDNASRVIEEVISQFQKLTIDMIGNEYIEKKQLQKRGLHLNGFGLKKFAQNLIVGIREL